MKLVDDWREAKRWWSMRWIIVSTFCSAAALAYPLLPGDWTASLPSWMKGALAGGAMLAGGAAAVARVVKQKIAQLPTATVPAPAPVPAAPGTPP